MIVARERFNLWLLTGLHTLLALSIPALIVLLSGCMRAGAHKEDLGGEVSPDVINQALDRIQKKATFNNLKVGQYLLFADTRRIENSENAIVLGAQRIDVIDRQDTPDQARFTLLITSSTRLLDGKFETKVAESALWLKKVSTAVSTATLATLGLEPNPGNKITAESLAQSRDVTVEKPQRISFHNFNESDGVVPASATLKGRSDCAGLNPCEIPAHFLHFDMVIWRDGEDYQKISFDFAYSIKTPFIPIGSAFDELTGLMVTNCRATYIPLESRTVYVRDCLTLDDFQN